MQDKLLEFAELLRANGLRVSPAELLDAVGAVARTGLGEREVLRAALASTMVKRAREVPVFEELFELYFSGLGEIIRQTGRAIQRALAMGDREFQEFLEQVERMLRESGRELSELARAILLHNTGELERRLREAARQARLSSIRRPLEENHFAKALERAVGLAELERELNEVRKAIGALPYDAETRERLDTYVGIRIRELQEIIRRYVRLDRQSRDPAARDRSRLSDIGEKSFYHLSEAELDRMRQAVTRLAQRLRNVVAIRRRRGRRGRFDAKRTLRRSLEHGGVPFRLVFDRRKREKPQVVVLCDVSDSVRNASRFMLQFVYSLQDLYSRVRSFVFVADIGEVTEHFRNHDAAQALEAALSGGIVNVYAHSNFGRAFKTFASDHIGAINRRTTVIVMGDARNNWNLPYDSCLREVRQRARQLIWLNPESRSTWGFGDSVMDQYAVHCDLVEECRNLNQLYRVVDRLLPR